MSFKHKGMKLLRRSLSWLLLLGTLFVAVAGNSLPVSAAETDTQLYGKYKLSFEALIKDPANKGSIYYKRNSVEFSSDNRLFLYLHTIRDDEGYRFYRVGALLDDGSCVNVVSLTAPINITMHSARTLTYKYSDDSLYSDWVWDGKDSERFVTSFLSFNAYSDADYNCSTYVFESLSAAYAYFDTGDKSGVIRFPESSGDGSDTNNDWLQDLINKLKEWEDGAFGALVGPFIAFGEGLHDIKNTILSLLPERIREVVSGILDDSVRIAWDVFNMVGDIRSFLQDKALELFYFLKDIHDELVRIGSGVFSLSWDLLPDGIKEKLQPWIDGLSGLLEKVRDGIDSLGHKLADMVPSFNDIRNAIKNSRIGEYVSDIKEDFSKLKELLTSFPAMSAAVSNFLEDPFYYIKKGMEKGFKDSFLGLLILPSDKFMEEFGADLKEDFSGIFAIADEVKKVIDFMAKASGTKAPSFTIDLGKSASYDLGNTSVTIDFAWYEAYKPTVDLLFSAIIWVGFLWRMYSRIPEIVNGVGMAVSMPYQIEHMEMEKEHRDMMRSRSDARWAAWVDAQLERRKRR